MFQRRGANSSALCQQLPCGDDQLAVTRGYAPVGQIECVLQTGTDAMGARHGAAVDRPRGDAVAVVDLLEPDAAFGERPLDGLGVGDRIMGIGVQGLDQRPYAARRYPRGDEGACVVKRQQSSLDPDAPATSSSQSSRIPSSP